MVELVEKFRQSQLLNNLNNLNPQQKKGAIYCVNSPRPCHTTLSAQEVLAKASGLALKTKPMLRI